VTGRGGGGLEKHCSAATHPPADATVESKLAILFLLAAFAMADGRKGR